MIVMFQSIEELNQTLLENPEYGYGLLSMENYLLLIAVDEATDDFLVTLENNGHLPRTVAFFTEDQGYKVRLYQRAEGFKNDLFSFFGLHMGFATYPDVTETTVASPLLRYRDYEKVGDRSLLQNEPATLDEKALKVFQSMFFLGDCLSKPKQ